MNALMLTTLAVGACGSVSPLAVDGQASSTGGVGGGMGSGGSAGSRGAGGALGVGGAGGALGVGGTGGYLGPAPCLEILTLDRSCTTSADCVAVPHNVDCWPHDHFLGLRLTEQDRFQTLEYQCERYGFGQCAPADVPATTDDGSRLPADRKPGVTCDHGVCTTFVPECGAPCASGTTCFSCADHSTTFAACTTTCAAGGSCGDPALPLCQYGASGNTAGMFCTAAGVACDTK